MSEDYRPGNLLDRLSRPETLQLHYDQTHRRELELLARRLPLAGGDVLSIGSGYHPGRHLFPAPAFRLVAADLDPEKVRVSIENGADEGVTGRAGELPFADGSFDVVLYRLVLHHIAYQGPLAPCFEEARRLLRRGGAMVAVEPNVRHPIGAALALANRLRLGPLVHGTPDDIPLSPRRLRKEALRAGLEPEHHAVTYTWRRLPPPLQRALQPLDALGSLPVLRSAAHTLLLIARRP